MEFGRSPALLLLVGFPWSQLQFGAEAAGTTVFTLHNNCTYTVWPTTLSGNTAVVVGGGRLRAVARRQRLVPSPGWLVRPLVGAHGLCTLRHRVPRLCHGDFGGAVSCSLGGAPPITLAAFTLGGADGKGFYDMSLVGGGRRGSPRAAPPPAAASPLAGR
nr:thaumatin-like protein PWIR2 [Oryza sativa Japonica Group]